jgi:hypothetical protein
MVAMPLLLAFARLALNSISALILTNPECGSRLTYLTGTRVLSSSELEELMLTLFLLLLLLLMSLLLLLLLSELVVLQMELGPGLPSEEDSLRGVSMF